MHYADYKTILSATNGMNVYRGCTHGCIYCDSRSLCYKIEHDFEDIRVKRNASSILDRQLSQKRKRCMIGTGAMCDPYIPLEEELGVTRSCLQVIARHGFGLAIQTKSARILRDAGLLTEIHKKARCVVQTTLTTHDEGLCRILEPHVCVTEERVRMLEAFRDMGIPTVVWLSPILPFINDTPQNLEGILDGCIRAGVRGILCFGFGMTLREGNREYFYRQLDAHFPGMKERYIRTFGARYEVKSPHDAALTALFKRVCGQHGILHRPDDVFAYLRDLTTGVEQTSLI